MKYIPAITLRAITEHEQISELRCCFCYHTHTANEPCQQRRRPRKLTKSRPPPSALTSMPSPPRPNYTGPRTHNRDSARQTSAIGEHPEPVDPNRFTPVLRIVPTPYGSIKRETTPPSSPGSPRLRRRDSPTELSLRELRCQQQQQQQASLRTQRSEMKLQRAYESQLEEYLNGGFVALDNIRE